MWLAWIMLWITSVSLISSTTEREVSGRTAADFRYLGTYLFQTSTPAQKISFFISNYYATHAESEKDCRDIFMGLLLSLESGSKDSVVKTFLEGLEDILIDRVHTSGKFNELSGGWEWYTLAEAFSFTNWATFHGDPLPGYCCTKTTAFYNFKWQSISCSDYYKFICEINLEFDTETTL